MTDFFERPILNSPYEYPNRHRELVDTGHSTGRHIDRWRRAEFITPIPTPKTHKAGQQAMIFDEGRGLSTEAQRVLLPRDSYYQGRQLVPNDLLRDLERYKTSSPTSTPLSSARLWKSPRAGGPCSRAGVGITSYRSSSAAPPTRHRKPPPALVPTRPEGAAATATEPAETSRRKCPPMMNREMTGRRRKQGPGGHGHDYYA